MTCAVYEKRAGTTGIRGQLYETKLLSLINLRAIHDACIEEFYLATNVADIGAFDDICFRAKIQDFDRPVALFIQAKHRENEKFELDSKNDLAKYFDSYLKIRSRFAPSNKDVLFEGHFDETDCLFVMYTTASDSSNNDLVENSLTDKLNDLIGTGDAAKQSNKKQEDVEFLCKIVIQEHMVALAQKMIQVIFGKANLTTFLNDELVLRYHVILAQKVINVSEIHSEGHRKAVLREDFFDTKEEFLFLLKETLCKLAIRERKLKRTEAEWWLSAFFEEPSEAETLRKLIGCVLDYDDGQFKFIIESTNDSLKQILSKVYVAPSTVKLAIEPGAKELLSRQFKVPAAFGNNDMTVRGNNMKIEKRLDHLTLQLSMLISESKPNNIVTIDESLEKGFLEMNGGIASAVGNILVCDENPKLMKFTDNCDALGDLAKRLFEKLKDKIGNLNKYKLEVKVKKFPKLSFDTSEHEEDLAKDFLNKLLFYTKQADESGVEDIIKSDIEDYQRNNVNNIQVRNETIFLKYHDAIQKWWMKSKQAPYLTKESGIYENVINKILKTFLLNVLNTMYMTKIENIYKFNEDAVMSLKLQDQLSRTVIVAESIKLTLFKVLQYLKSKNHYILQMEYILNLQRNDLNDLCVELTNTGEEIILVFICDHIQHCRNLRKKLENVAKAVYNKKIVMITNSASVVIIKEYFKVTDEVIHDTRNNLSDMNDDTQKSILRNSRVIFQGRKIRLDLIVDKALIPLVHGDIFNSIIRKEMLTVGKSISNPNYDKIKHLYFDRRVAKPGERIGKIIKTMYAIKEDVVLFTALPGMGKSTLLTHLSLKTKEVDPKVWIVRINLLEYSSVFGKWRENKTAIGSLETVNLMCHVILNEKHGAADGVSIALEESNGVVSLKECSADQSAVFELKMFLHYYNTKKLIFVFDGFDEICPHYAVDVIKCINIVRNHHRKHKIWIASRPYSEIKHLLEREFGTSYEIEPLSYYERQKYLEKFWKYNLVLKDLNDQQLDNVYHFLEFILSQNHHHYCESNLNEIYLNAVVYFINEIKSSYIPLWKYNINDYTAIISREKMKVDLGRYRRENNNGIPLHLFLKADFFVNEVKNIDKTIERWNLNISTHAVYERYIEVKFKSIRLQEKNKVDVYNPDIMITYNQERIDFIMKHKKLAAYAIYHQHKHELFDENQLKEIEGTIQLYNKGEEKVGFIYGTADHIPMFIHKTFAEYFAAEYICDAFKNVSCTENDKQHSVVVRLMHLVFESSEVREHVDYKMKLDDELVDVMKKNAKLIFDALMEEGKVYSEYINNWNALTARENKKSWWLSTAVTFQLNSFTNLFLWIIESNLNEHNLTDFINIAIGSNIFIMAHNGDNFEMIGYAFNIVRNIDESKLSSVVFDNFGSVSRDIDVDAMSTSEIINHIKQCYVGLTPPYLRSYLRYNSQDFG